MEIQEILNNIIIQSCNILKDNLVGIYLHGSLAMGCFNPRKSDLDLMFVTEHDVPDQQKRLFMDYIIRMNELAPDKGIELSFARAEFCANFIYPTPFELHFSNMHLNWYRNNPMDYIEKMKGTDPDLAAHFTIIKHRGKTLYGKPINEVFGEVPAEAYLDSIKKDIEGAIEDVVDNPIYIILNLCRVLAFIQEGLVLSKREGGEWGLKNIDPVYHELIAEALECYGSERNIVVDQSLAQSFCKLMMNKIGI